MDGEFRKYLAVEDYAEFGQTVYELTVAQAFGSAGGVDANNPKFAEADRLACLIPLNAPTPTATIATSRR